MKAIKDLTEEELEQYVLYRSLYPGEPRGVKGVRYEFICRWGKYDYYLTGHFGWTFYKHIPKSRRAHGEYVDARIADKRGIVYWVRKVARARGLMA